jgi:hypothetical protein
VGRILDPFRVFRSYGLTTPVVEPGGKIYEEPSVPFWVDTAEPFREDATVPFCMDSPGSLRASAGSSGAADMWDGDGTGCAIVVPVVVVKRFLGVSREWGPRPRGRRDVG